MPSSRQPSKVAQMERSIESKQRLLDYLRSGPKHLTIESYICLTRILNEARWGYDGKHWHKGDQCVGLHEAAQLELAAQIAASKEKILRQTVRNYPG